MRNYIDYNIIYDDLYQKIFRELSLYKSCFYFAVAIEKELFFIYVFN